MSGDLSAQDTAELDRYRDWLGRIVTPDETRPLWFTTDTAELPVVPATDDEPRPRYSGRHRHPRPSWWVRMGGWWRTNSQPVLIDDEEEP